MDLHEDAPDPATAVDPDQLDPEAPLADALEQHAELSPPPEEPVADVPVEVDSADLLEQRQAVAGDEDDYR